MSYNWKCCSFYPNNFDASALISAYQFCACNRLEVLNFRGVSECFTATKVNYFITEEIPGYICQFL